MVPKKTWLNTFFCIVLSISIAIYLFSTNVFGLVPALAVCFFGITIGLLLGQDVKVNPKGSKAYVTSSDLNAKSKSSTSKLTTLIKQQQNTYQQVFLKNPTTFHQPTFHYDWWMFPIPVHPAASSTSKQYAVNDVEITQLLQHDLFMKTYFLSIEKYLNNLSKHGWNQYPIRYEKMLRSLSCFISVSQNLTKNHNIESIQKKLYPLASKAVEYAEQNHMNTGRMAILIRDVKKILMGDVLTSKKEFAPAFRSVSLSNTEKCIAALSSEALLNADVRLKKMSS
ncbi:hypothetical protein CC99x_003525 [Candidatus Berkiella cookevillensis]|nr:hypothetical protein [Candidatus Berkiella cookevillensis]MCS5707968.1 hypothetical protein [Candidatus Berkiella cookevillensis]